MAYILSLFISASLACTSMEVVDGRSFDLSPLREALSLHASGLQYQLTLCGRVFGKNTFSPSCPRHPALAYQITADGSCYAVALYRHQILATREGLALELRGGDLCGTTMRSLRVEIECVSGANTTLVSIEESCGPCCYVAVVRSPAGCAAACPADPATGLPCGSPARGVCVQSAGPPAVCSCRPGFFGATCGGSGESGSGLAGAPQMGAIVLALLLLCLVLCSAGAVRAAMCLSKRTAVALFLFLLLLLAYSSGSALVPINGARSPVRAVVTSPHPGSHNVTLVVPCASLDDFGAGSFFLPSGRRVHAFRDVVHSLPLNQRCSLLVTVRSERKSATALLSLASTESVARALRSGWLWEGSTPPPPTAFFVLASFFDDGFIHWILECAVFLDYWAEIKAIAPSVKLVLHRRKAFMAPLLPIFGVAPEDVVFNSGSSLIPAWAEHGKLPLGHDWRGAPLIPAVFQPLGPEAYTTPNVAFFPPGQYLHDVFFNAELLRDTLVAFLRRAREFAGIELSTEPAPTAQQRGVLILPRARKENVDSRAIPELDALVEMANGVQGVEVLYVDELKDIRPQIRAVARAKVVFLAAGSASYFNLLFASNATIYLLGPDRFNNDLAGWPTFRVLWDLVGPLNKVVVRDKRVPEHELRDIFSSSLAGRPMIR